MTVYSDGHIFLPLTIILLATAIVIAQDVEVSIENIDSNVLVSGLNGSLFVEVPTDITATSKIKIICSKIHNRTNGTLIAFVNTKVATVLSNCEQYAAGYAGTNNEFYCIERTFVYDLAVEAQTTTYFNIECRIKETFELDQRILYLPKLYRDALPRIRANYVSLNDFGYTPPFDIDSYVLSCEAITDASPQSIQTIQWFTIYKESFNLNFEKTEITNNTFNLSTTFELNYDNRHLYNPSETYKCCTVFDNVPINCTSVYVTGTGSRFFATFSTTTTAKPVTTTVSITTTTSVPITTTTGLVTTEITTEVTTEAITTIDMVLNTTTEIVETNATIIGNLTTTTAISITPSKIRSLKSGLGTNEIIIIASCGGGFILLLLIIFISLFCYRKKLFSKNRRKKSSVAKQTSSFPIQIKESFSGDLLRKPTPNGMFTQAILEANEFEPPRKKSVAPKIVTSDSDDFIDAFDDTKVRNLTDIELDATEPSKLMLMSTLNEVTLDEFPNRLGVPRDFHPPSTPPPIPSLSTNIRDYLSEATFVSLVNDTTEEPAAHHQNLKQHEPELEQPHEPQTTVLY